MTQLWRARCHSGMLRKVLWWPGQMFFQSRASASLVQMQSSQGMCMLSRVLIHPHWCFCIHGCVVSSSLELECGYSLTYCCDARNETSICNTYTNMCSFHLPGIYIKRLTGSKKGVPFRFPVISYPSAPSLFWAPSLDVYTLQMCHCDVRAVARPKQKATKATGTRRTK